MAEIKITFKGLQRVLKKVRTARQKFFNFLIKKWSSDAEKMIQFIRTTQLSGRPGLNIRTGQARRALVFKIKRIGNNIFLRFFLDPVNPARVYLPTHDISNRKQYIRAKAGKYLKFKIGGEWVQVKKVKIIKRISILKTLREQGKKRLVASVNNAAKVYI